MSVESIGALRGSMLSDPGRGLRHRPFLPGDRRFAVVAVLGVLLALVGCGPARAAPLPAPTYTRNEPAIATASPAMVYLEATYTGFVRDTATGLPREEAPVVFQRRCSGVVVDPDGSVLTTTVCVQPSADIVLVNALYRLGRDLVEQGKVAADKLDSYVAAVQPASVFTGAEATTPPSIQLFGQLDVATPKLTTEPAIPASVVAALPANSGNAALVRLQGKDFPAVELTTAADPRPGDSVVILGYGPGNSPSMADYATLRAKTVTVTGRTATNRLGLSADIGPDSRGGAVLGLDGRLVGLLDTDINTEGDPTHDLIATLHLKTVLTQAKVTNRLSDVDRGYRDGLTAYFAGRFSRATAKLDRVLQLQPTHTGAQTYRTRAHERLVTEGDSVENRATWSQYAILTALGVLGIVVIGAAARLVRHLAARRRRAPPAEPITVVLPRIDPDTVVLAVIVDDEDTVVLPGPTAGSA